MPKVLERAAITVAEGSQDEFEAVFVKARQHIVSAPGCLSVRLLRGVESPTSYLLLVEWRTLEDHLEGFRSSPQFEQWRALVGPFFAAPPEVEHFVRADVADPLHMPGPLTA